MDDDLWRADGSFRGMAGGAGGKGGGGKKGGGPQFNRVIPKFLQKYHQVPSGPSIETKFQAPPGEDDGKEEELDEVQKAAIEEFMKKEKEKREAVEGDDAEREKSKSKKQKVATMGTSDTKEKKSGKKRKRKDVKALSNKKLLSFSMDDEEE